MASKVTVTTLLERAGRLSTRETRRLGFDPIEAKRSCNLGLRALKRHLPRLRKHFPGFEADALLLLPALCDELKTLQRKAQQAADPAGSMKALQEAARWRRTLLPLAQSLSESGRVEPRAIDKILRGSGPSDLAQDVADLVALLEPSAAVVEAVAGPKALEQARQASAAALQALGTVGTDNTEQARRRDQVGTLVALLHERLRSAVAAVTSYQEAAVLVPPLSTGRALRTQAPAPSPEGSTPAS